MPDPYTFLQRELTDMRRRIHDLETAPRASRTSVQNGFTRWLPPDGEYPVIYIGSLVDGDVALRVDDGPDANDIFVGTSGGNPLVYAGADTDVEFRNPDNTARVWLSLDGVVSFPVFASPWQRNVQFPMDANGRSTTTAAAYGANMWYSMLSVGQPRVRSSIDIDVGAGVTSCAFRITAQVLNGRSGHSIEPEQVVYEQTGITADTSVTDTWDVPSTLYSPAADPIGAFVQFGLKIRVTGGAGTVGIGPIFPLYGQP